MADNQGKPEGRDGEAVPRVVNLDELFQGKLKGRDGAAVPRVVNLDEFNLERIAELDRQIKRGAWKGTPLDILDKIGADYRGCEIKEGLLLPTLGGQLKIPYLDADGNQFVQAPYTREDGREFPAIPVVRIYVRGADGDWEPRWVPGYKLSEGVPFLPFGLCPLHERPNRLLIITEGESDTLCAGRSARHEGVNADMFGVAGITAWRDEWAEEYCTIYPVAYVAGDGDDAGRNLNAKAAKALQAAGVEARIIPIEEGKDLRDHLEDGLLLTDLLEDADRRAKLLETLMPALGEETPKEGLAAHVRPVVDTDPPRLPALLESDGGGATIVYAGKLHTFHGKPGTGKTWIALLAAAEANRVLWWDFEDKPATLARRAKLLGAHNILNPERTKYVVPSLIEDPAAIKEAQDWMAEGDPEKNVVIIDSAESASCHGDGADVAEWFGAYVRPWQDVGATVIVIDHVPKSDENRPRGPIGSQHKLARIDGASILFQGTPWTKNEPGQIDLTVDKDRPGDMPAINKPLATIIGDYDEHSAFWVSIVAADDKPEFDELELRVLQSVEKHGGFDSNKALTKNTTGKDSDVMAAADRLAERGLLERTEQGRGQGTQWRLTDAGKGRPQKGLPSSARLRADPVSTRRRALPRALPPLKGRRPGRAPTAACSRAHQSPHGLPMGRQTPSGGQAPPGFRSFTRSPTATPRGCPAPPRSSPSWPD